MSLIKKYFCDGHIAKGIILNKKKMHSYLQYKNKVNITVFS